MAPILRSRKSAPLESTPAPEQKKPKPKHKAKKKHKSSARKHKVGKHRVESPEKPEDEPIAHGHDVYPSPSPLPRTLHVRFAPEAQERQPGKRVPPFTFRYNGLKVTGGTFEERASVIMAFLGCRGSSGIQSEPDIREDRHDYRGETGVSSSSAKKHGGRRGRPRAT